jgi:peptidoglycan/LPS O-acetylase OafA/YrhL
MATATLGSQTELNASDASSFNRARRADIQGLRGVAVLLVVAFHAAILVPGGYIGVDVFFVISGFVITNLLLRELLATEHIAFRQFYARRIRRLLPALALLIVGVCLAGVFFLSPLGTQQQTGMLGRAAATFRANLSLYGGKNRYFDISANNNPLLHTWSLGVEEQFYLFFPLFLVAAWTWGTRLIPTRSRRRAAAVLTGVVAGTSLWLSIDLTAGHSLGSTIARPSLFAFYSLPTRAWEFALGTLVALAVPWLQRQRRDLSVLAGGLGIVLILASARLMTTFTAFPGTAALLPVGGAALVIAAGTVTADGVGRLLALRPLVWLGDLSYSWYLWHWPLIVFAAAIWPTHGKLLLPTVAVLSLIPSWLSYRYVEQPFRMQAPWTRRRAVSIAALCIAGPVAFSLLVPQLSRQVVSQTTKASLEHQLRPHEMNTAPCVGVVQQEPRRKCTATPTGASRGEVWLVGDSQAGMLTESVKTAAVAEGYTFVASHFQQCPFVDLLVIARIDGRATACRQFVRKTVDNLVARKPSLVVIASASAEYVEGGGFALVDVRSNRTGKSPRAKAELWRDGLQRVLQRFDDSSIPTLVVSSIPYYGSWDPRTCAAVVIAKGARHCGTSRSRASVQADQERALAAEQSATRATGADTIDFTERLCSQRRCATNEGDFFVYMDGHHLSADGALRFTDEFQSRIERDAQATPGVR